MDQTTEKHESASDRRCAAAFWPAVPASTARPPMAGPDHAGPRRLGFPRPRYCPGRARRPRAVDLDRCRWRSWRTPTRASSPMPPGAALKLTSLGKPRSWPTTGRQGALHPRTLAPLVEEPASRCGARTASLPRKAVGRTQDSSRISARNGASQAVTLSMPRVALISPFEPAPRHAASARRRWRVALGAPPGPADVEGCFRSPVPVTARVSSSRP